MPSKNGFEWFVTPLSNYAGFQGRSTRKEFWYFSLFQFVCIFAAGVILDAFKVSEIATLVSLGLLLPSIAVGVRRLHDTNHSGWWYLMPIVNIVFWVQESDKSENRFGPTYHSDEGTGLIRKPKFSQGMNNLDQIERLAEMRDKGILTEDEFNVKKASLL